MEAQHLNDRAVACLMVEWLLISGKMDEEQKVIEPDALDLYVFVFPNIGYAGVC